MGADMLTTVLVVEALAKRCGSTALCYKMHLEGAELVTRIGTPDQVERIVRRIPTGEVFFTVAGAEASGRGGAWSPDMPRGTVERADGGYQINAIRKAYVTSAGYATHHFFPCRIGKDTPPTEQSLLVVERDQVEWSIDEPWDGLGMRGNHSSPMTFSGFVPKTNLLGEEGRGMAAHRDKFVSIALCTYAAAYLGIAAGAFDEARAFVQLPVDKDRRRIDGETAQRRMAEMSVEVERSRALLYAAASAFDRGWPGPPLPYLQAKVACAETATRVTAEIMTLGGGTAFARRLPFDRYFRDARAGVVMGVANDTALLNASAAMFPKPKA